MRPLPIDLKEEAQVALVSNRNRLPSARFPDDQEIRRRMICEQCARPARIELFSNRADDDDLARLSMAAGGDEGGREGTFRVTGPATVQPAVLETNGQGSIDRVDVPEEDDGRRTPADSRDRVSGGVRTFVQAEAASQFEEPVDGGSFTSRRAVFVQKSPKDVDVIHVIASSQERPGRMTIDGPGGRGAAGDGRRWIHRRSRGRPLLAMPGGPERPFLATRCRSSTRARGLRARRAPRDPAISRRR